MDLSDTSIPALQIWACEQFANDVAIRDVGEGGRDLTYTQLGQDVERCAGALVANGVQPGDRIAIWAPNSWKWIVTSLAILRAGAILVPVNTRLKGAEASYLLRFSGAKIVFVANFFLDIDYVGQLQSADADLARQLRIIDFNAEPGSDASFNRFVATAAAATDAPSEVARRSSQIKPDDISLIMFTSGTTGRPKGAMVRGGAIIRAFTTFKDRIGVRRGDAFLNVNPFFHAFGFNCGILPCLMVGAVNIPMAMWDVDRALALIEQEKITIFPGPPSVFQDLLRHPRLGDYDISSLRGTITGASTIPPDLVPRMKQVLGFERVVTGYGTTEVSGAGTMCLPEDSDERITLTCGSPFPGLEAKIVDEDGNDLGREAQGELLLRGFAVMAGYYRDEAATREAIDKDGWLHTGDIAYMDDAGYIKITDRKKDMFIVGGFNVYPAEVEILLLQHPEIAQVAVVGVPDQRLGEVGAAFVVAAAGARVTTNEIMEWCAERLANYKRPRHIWIVPQLPYNASGKILKFELRNKARELVAKG